MGAWDRTLDSLGFEASAQARRTGKGEVGVSRGQVCRGPQGPGITIFFFFWGQTLDVLGRGERQGGGTVGGLGWTGEAPCCHFTRMGMCWMEHLVSKHHPHFLPVMSP